MVALVLVAVACTIVVVVTHVMLMRRLEAFFVSRQRQIDELDEGRRRALYKQQKASERNVARSDAAVRKLADRTRHLQEETEIAQRRAEAFFNDPAVKRALRKAGGQDG